MASVTVTVTDRSASSVRRIVGGVRSHAGLLGLFAALAVFATRRLGFLGFDNLTSIATALSVLAIAGVGLTVVLSAGQYDVSVGPVVTLGGVVAVGLQTQQGVPVLLAVVLALVAGAAVGLVNALLVTKAGISSIIATLGSGSVVAGVALWYTDGKTLPAPGDGSYRKIASGSVLGFPNAALVMFVCVAVVEAVLEHTTTGRHLRAVGLSPRAARMTGLPLSRLVVASFVTSSVFAALAGVMLASRIGAAALGVGDNYLMYAYAACFIGAASVGRGRFNALGTLVGAALIAVLQSGFVQQGAEAWVEQVLVGAVLVTALLVSVRRR